MMSQCENIIYIRNYKLRQIIYEYGKKNIKIVWRNLGLTNLADGKNILYDLNGQVQSGNFLSIMGASGAGKSSFLGLLTARMRQHNTPLQIIGDILLNGQTYNLDEFSKISAYVQQDDLLFASLTVKETFIFQAQLKLWHKTDEEKQQLCLSLLKKLNLLQASNTLIGNSQFKKSISGGQKKRVSIGVELISNPQILIFDEPTSGLDSYNALVIIKLLAQLATTQNKLVITTIHQPSTLIFQQMSQLYLLRNGQCVYNGAANQIVSYMEGLNIKVNYRMNPADFFMLEISSLKEQSGYITPLNSTNFKQKSILPPQFYQYKKTYSIKNTQDYNLTPFSKQFRPLLERSFKNFYRTPSNQLNKILVAVLIPAFFGLLYFNIANQAPDLNPDFSNLQQISAYIFQLIGFLFIGLYFVFSMNTYDTVLIFPTEKQLVFKETGSNLYSIFAYFITRLLTQILGCVIPGIICGVVFYLTAGFELESGHFIVFVGLFTIMGLSGYLLGLLFGVLCKNSQTGITLMPMVMIPILIFGGLAVRISDIPSYIRWLQYFSSLRHSFLIMFQDQIQSSKYQKYAALNMVELYGLGGDPWEAFYYLLGLLGFFFFGSLMLLYILKKRI